MHPDLAKILYPHSFPYFWNIIRSPFAIWSTRPEIGMGWRQYFRAGCCE